ncbi:hypothetical protein Tco_0926388 [Tanacetum coccineum]|uniref:Uncharacterized protein n=1 Tax=Tanacetum coccineum TaxID=301880 RepID=A0ABQ5DFY2_9ASTR
MDSLVVVLVDLPGDERSTVEDSAIEWVIHQEPSSMYLGGKISSNEASASPSLCNPEIQQLTIKLGDEYGFVIRRFIIRTSLTGFPAQSVRSSNADALDSLYLLVSLYRTPQSRLPH